MRHRFHSICPYFAMFPETFVQKHLAASSLNGVVFDPFCGRGTTIFESLMQGRDAAGCDVHPVAACISGAKSDPPSQTEVFLRLAELNDEVSWSNTSEDFGDLLEFFHMCFHSRTLQEICFLRNRLDWKHQIVLIALLLPFALERCTASHIEAPTILATECQGQ